MARNLYALASSLLLFSLISCGMSMLPSSAQPGLPGNGSLWKTTALFLFVGALVALLAGSIATLYSQVERRNEERGRRRNR